MKAYNKPDNRPKLVNTYNVKKKKSSKEYYDENPASKAKKEAYNTEYNKRPSRKSYRAELARERRKRGLMMR